MRTAAIALAAGLLACAGERQAVRQEGHTLTETGVLTGSPGDWRFAPGETTAFPIELSPSTTVTEGGAPASLGSIQEGAPARVTYELAPGSRAPRAVRVEVLPQHEVRPLGAAPEPGLDVLEPEAGGARDPSAPSR